MNNINIVEDFYNNLAEYYHLIYKSWDRAIEAQSFVLDETLKRFGIDKDMRILDCACGIGTQTLGLALLGYNVLGSDISIREVERAKKEAENRSIEVEFLVTDFSKLSECFKSKFNAIIAMDNALPHITDHNNLTRALQSIYLQIEPDGVFISSIRDYDEVLMTKPQITQPNVIETEKGKCVAFQLWNWENDIYDFTQYLVIEENDIIKTQKFICKYWAITRCELTSILKEVGFKRIEWIFPEYSKYHQPILIAKK
jgi:SAM-dependent methyltransferase